MSSEQLKELRELVEQLDHDKDTSPLMPTGLVGAMQIRFVSKEERDSCSCKPNCLRCKFDAALLAKQEATGPEAAPWLYAIEETNQEGKKSWHDGENCVFSDLASAQDEVDSLNDSVPEGEGSPYAVVPLYRPPVLISAELLSRLVSKNCDWKEIARVLNLEPVPTTDSTPPIEPVARRQWDRERAAEAPASQRLSEEQVIDALNATKYEHGDFAPECGSHSSTWVKRFTMALNAALGSVEQADKRRAVSNWGISENLSVLPKEAPAPPAPDIDESPTEWGRVLDPPIAMKQEEIGPFLKDIANPPAPEEEKA